MWNKFKNIFNNNNPETLQKNLSQNIKIFKELFSEVDDLEFRPLTIDLGGENSIKGCLIYINNMVNKENLNDDLIKPLTEKNKINLPLQTNKEGLIPLLRKKVINLEKTVEFKEINQGVEDILSGNTLLLIDGYSQGLSLGTQGWTERAVSAPHVERTVRGPQEAFMENIKVNIGLVRRRVRSSKLKVISFNLGEFSKTEVIIMYLEGIASSVIVEEVKKRISDIKVGQIIGCSQTAELIDDNPQSIFNTIYESERPDVIAAGLHEGRVAILTDGCPTALLVPKLFMENLISPEDYYYRFWFTLPIRLMRFTAYIISTMLPAIYVSMVAYHQELIPMTLARTIFTSRAGVPFPVFFELLIFLFLFEVIKEAGATVPEALSTSTTIVGTLILGQAAITARFLSADGVIIGSITGITIFVLPVIEFSQALLFIRFFFLAAAAMGGFYGLTLAIIIVIIHLASLRSFGVPFLTPIAPLKLKDLKDLIIRVPYLFMDGRPEVLEGKNQTRQDNKPYRRYFFKFKLWENNDTDKGGSEK